MALIQRLRVTWTGSPVVGPGVSTFYCNVTAEAVVAAQLRTFFDAIKAYVPDGVQWVVLPAGDTMTVENGDIAGSWSFSPPLAPVSSAGGVPFTNGVGGRISWLTGGIFHGRHVRGATFIVPLRASAYEGAGNLEASVLSGLQTAASALVAAAEPLFIWSVPDAGATDGEVNEVLGAIVQDKVSWLRSRRT